MEHFNLDQIQSYLENQIENSQATEIENHIATCQQCHSIYAGLLSIEDTLIQSFETGNATPTCPEDWEVGAHVKEELPSEISDKISNHIKDCSYCIDRAAVFYKALKSEEVPVEAPIFWKQKAIQTLKSDETDKEKSQVSFLKGLFDFLHKLASPVPAFAGYAVALFAIALLVWTNLPDRSRIVTITSTEKIILRDSEVPSSFGFTGADVVSNVSDMKIEHKGNSIYFQWIAIGNAKGYKFALMKKGKVFFNKGILLDPELSIKTDLLAENIVYSWLIKGKTEDNKYFEYTGDFIFVK